MGLAVGPSIRNKPLCPLFKIALVATRPAAGIEHGSPQGGGACPAWRGGDLGSPRKPAGAAPGNRGLPVKARSRPKNLPNLSAEKCLIPHGCLRGRSRSA